MNSKNDIADILAQIAENARQAEMESRKVSKEEAELLQFKAEERWRTLKKNAGIPPRYFNADFATIKAKGVPRDVVLMATAAWEYASNFMAEQKDGKGLIFAGAAGRMKTTFAVAIMQKVMRDGGNAFFISMPELLDKLYSMARNSDPTERQRFENRIRMTHLLVLDDFGGEYPSGWVLNKVDAIISYRYNYLLPTVLTTNLTPEEMKGRYVERVVDRLRSAYTMLIAEGESLRPSGDFVKKEKKE